MNDPEQDLFEQELRRLHPAAPPAAVKHRLLAARPVALRRGRGHAPVPSLASLILRWLVPAMAVFVAAAFYWRSHHRQPAEPMLAINRPAELTPAVEADHVQLEEKLLRSFDTVALLPGGEPVRFRCMEWLDEITLRDKERGVTIEQRSPRVEVVPVRFETY